MKGREQRGIPLYQSDDLAMNPIQEDVGIERTDNQRQCHQILHAVHTQQRLQTLIEQRQWPYEECEQRVTVHLIQHIPVCHREIRQRVISREMQLALEHLPIRAETLLHEQVVHAIDKKAVKHHDHRQGNHRLEPFLALDLK